ncbi:MAG: MerR family transcriptional regulator [Pseudomonadota bacterium]
MKGQEPRFAIGAMSRRTGCNIETIRYYERIGLLPAPARSAGGYRMYGLDDLKRLAFIRRAREVGFTLEAVRALLRLADRRVGSCAEVRDLAAAHLGDVRDKIADLEKMDKVLTRMVAACADGTLPDCPVIEALYKEPA